MTEISVRSYGGGAFEVELSDGSIVKRPVTPAEQALMGALEEILTADTHGVWHRFRAEVLEAGDDNDARDELAEAFAAAHPEWVTGTGVDNDRFMSSAVWLVRHGTGANHMGTSLVYLSQGESEPVELFLYPGHAQGLVAAVTALEPSLETLEQSPFCADEFIARHLAKPSPFDAWRNRWREKPWYAEMGHTERLEALASGGGA